MSLEEQYNEREHIRNTFGAQTILNMIWYACTFKLSTIGSSFKDIKDCQEFKVLIDIGIILGFVDDGGMWALIERIIPEIIEQDAISKKTCITLI